MIGRAPIRNDKHGRGHYGARRFRNGVLYDHHGVDLAFMAGTEVMSINRGKVTKFGYPYAKHLEYRYVEITDSDGLRFRYFYVLPSPDIAIGDLIRVGDPIGVVQDLDPLYSGVTCHVHLEIKDEENEYYDPTQFI